MPIVKAIPVRLDLNVAIAVHGPALPSFFRGYFDVNRPDHMLEASHMAHTFAQMLACSNIVTGGVLERFPRLRIAFLDNSRPKADLFLARVEELLARRYKFAQVLRLRKNTASSPHPDLPAVVRSADMVVEAFAQ